MFKLHNHISADLQRPNLMAVAKKWLQ